MDKTLLTETQLSIADSTDSSLAVIAGAGSGKTLVLIERLKKIISEPGAGLERFVAITFTEKAAAELKNRLRPDLGPALEPKLSKAWIGTFHAFEARVLKAHAPRAGLDPSFRILEENAARFLARQAVEESFIALLDRGSKDAALLVEELEYQNAVGSIVELMSFRWHAAKVFEIKSGSDERERKLLFAASRCFEAALARLHSIFDRSNSIDFQELEIRTLKLFKDNPDILSNYRKRFRHILVDEYQDTNDIQDMLIELLHDPKSNRAFIVGDPRQSIYRFRGANVSCFAMAAGRITAGGGSVVGLVENFRSRPEIIDFINLATKPIEDSLFKGLDSIMPAGRITLVASRPKEKTPALTLLECKGRNDMPASERRILEARAIASYVSGLIESGKRNPGDIACLFRAITAVETYESAFREFGIPCRVYGGRHLLAKPEITDLMAGLAYAADHTNDAALLTLARSPLIGLSDDESVILAGENGKCFRQNILTHPKAEKILARLKKAGTHRNPSEVIRLVLDETGYEVFCAAADPSGLKLANIDKLITIAHSLESEAPTSLKSFVDYISALKDESARIGDPPAAATGQKLVRCMTVHAAKGLEFPVVILPDLIRQPLAHAKSWIFVRGEGLAYKWRDPSRPFGKKIESPGFVSMLQKDVLEEEEESRRLLYVALTRAKECLVLPIHDMAESRGKWHNWLKPAAWGNAEFEKITPSLPEANGIINDRDETLPFPVLAQGARAPAALPRAFSVSELEAFARCPQEYYLKYVARLPAQMVLAKRNGDLPANLRGQIIHEAIEGLEIGRTDRLEALLRNACLAHRIFPSSAMIANLTKPLGAFLEHPIFSEMDRGLKELKFDWQIGGHIVSGKLDLLLPVRDGFEIIDFKTDRVKPGQAKARAQSYDLQMTTYAIAVEECERKPVYRTRLYFLEAMSEQSEDMTEKRRGNGLSQIAEIIGRIVDSDFGTGGQKLPCEETFCNCPYHLNGLCWLDRGRDK